MENNSHETREQLLKKLKKIFAHLLNLNLSGFMNSDKFEIFIIENDLEEIKDKITNVLVGVGDESAYEFSTRELYSEKWVKNFLKEILLQIYFYKKEEFPKILVSLLRYYSKYNYNLKTYKPIPIDNEIIKSIGEDLLEMGYDIELLRSIFYTAGYDLKGILDKPIHVQSPYEVQSPYAQKTVASSESTHFNEGSRTISLAQSQSVQSKSVFVVHGHDHAMKDAVANYIHKLELNPIILGDEASGGDTLIEKLERFRDVKYAIVLLSPDDVGSKKPVGGTKPDLTTRARQNVIFELGLFIGCLGRANVCPMKNDVGELPSDYLGVGFVPYDKEGAWKLYLVRELVKAGFTIDPKKV